MSDFGCALTYTLFNEGSAFVNNPHDKGGATRYGVTRATLSRYLGRPATVDEVKALTPQAVAPLYERLYWNMIGAPVIGLQSVATMAFDCSVLCGASSANIFLYRACARAGVSSHRIATNMPASSRRVLEREFCLQWQAHLIAVAMQRRDQMRWLDGWVRRVQRAWRVLSLQHRELLRALAAKAPFR